MTNETVLTLRAMAWERAKGELNAYLEAFWPHYGPDGVLLDNGFEAACSRIKAFIKDFEENCG